MKIHLLYLSIYILILSFINYTIAKQNDAAGQFLVREQKKDTI